MQRLSRGGKDETLLPGQPQVQPDERRRLPDERHGPDACRSGSVLAWLHEGGTNMKRNRGFTLLELMVVVVVMAILAALAINSYSEQVRRAKRAEAVKSLVQFQMLMEKYRSTCPTYVDTATCRDRSVPPDGDAADANDAAYPAVPNVTANNYTYAITGTPTATQYVITATKKSSFADPKCGNFILTVDAGTTQKTVSAGDPNYCWRN
jgi:type IV pilus assembly protein PilE